MARSSRLGSGDRDANLHLLVGELSAHVGTLNEDLQQVLAKLEQTALENQQILRKIDKVESKLDPLPDVVNRHDERIVKLEQFDGKLMAIVTLAGIVVSAVGTGFWMLITHFSEVIAFGKKLFGGGP